MQEEKSDVRLPCVDQAVHGCTQFESIEVVTHTHLPNHIDKLHCHGHQATTSHRGVWGRRAGQVEVAASGDNAHCWVVHENQDLEAQDREGNWYKAVVKQTTPWLVKVAIVGTRVRCCCSC